MSDVTIVQLYPDELGVAGDRGNVMALRVRLELAGHTATLVQHRPGATLPDAADMVVVGAGPLSAIRTIHDDLLAIGPALRTLAASGVPVFAYGSGAEVLGQEIVLLKGGTLPGVGLFPFRARRTTDRKVGYILTDTEYGRLVGFEDHASRWELDEGAAPLGTVVVGGGNGDGREGVVAGASIATQVGGPALPLNPVLTDALLGSALSRRGLDYTPGEAGRLDNFAERARAVMVQHSKHVFSRI